MSNSASRVFCAVIAGTLVLLAARADAAMVSGVYASPGGKALADHQLHFQNRISGDMFLVRTGTDGAFSTDLPPGTYDLRAERGLILKSKVVVGEGSPMNIGRVTEGAPFDVRRPFERQGIGPALVETEAPATAHLDKLRSSASPTSVPSPAQAAAASLPTSANEGAMTVQPVE